MSFVGPVQIWGKAFAVPGDSDDLNSVSGMTQLFSMIEAGSLNVDIGEEIKQVARAEGFLNVTQEYRAGRKFEATCGVIVQSIEEQAICAGLLAGDVTNESSDTPKRYRVRQTVNDPLNYRNMVIRYRDPNNPTLWIGYYVPKARIHIDGAFKMGQDGETIVPIRITGIAVTTGTFADVAWEKYQEYELTTPVISGILPASQSVGHTVVISGQGFGSTQGSGVVTFYNSKVASTYLYWTDNSIAVVIPALASTGNVTVTAANGATSVGVSYTIV